MSDTREVRSVINAAEQAAAAGDYASAEQLLHTAAQLQEASLGPLHPDLANTLNNLAVVCEITEKPADAERYYRRAYAIATAALEPDHPFVATSRKNLEDFCRTRGIAIDAPAASPVTPIERESPPPPPVVPPEPDTPARSQEIVGDHQVAPPVRHVDLPIERPTHDESRRVTSSIWSSPIAVTALVAGALVVALIATAIWRDDSGPADVPKEVATTTSEPAEVTQKPIETPRPTPASPPAAKPTPVPPAPVKSRATTAAASSPPVVIAARLCKELSTGSDWHCAPPGSPVDPGAVYFYSRIQSPTDTTIQHRWYHGARLLRTAELRIGANASDGYRTFSRTTVNSRGSAEWRVELRSKDGAMLHEERFVVR
jgi:Tetratricopeptide repeat/Protein of unknown function (DUF2914)